MPTVDPLIEPSAAFALRRSADLLKASVLAGVLSTEAASALVGDSLSAMLDSIPGRRLRFEVSQGRLVPRSD